MAMTKCPECGKEVSDSAAMCPNCGYGVKAHFDSICIAEKIRESKNKKKKLIKIFAITGGITVVLLFVTFMAVFISPKGHKIYTENDIAIYDSLRDRYLHIGDTRERIESIIGEPDIDSSTAVGYKDIGLLVGYTENKVTQFQLEGASNTSERLRVAGVLTIKATESDFVDVYPDTGFSYLSEQAIYFKKIGKLLKASTIEDFDITVWYDASSNGYGKIVILAH